MLRRAPLLALLVAAAGIAVALVPWPAWGGCPWLAGGSSLDYIAHVLPHAWRTPVRAWFAASSGRPRDPETGLRLYDAEELKEHDGSVDGRPILLAIGHDKTSERDVFDVTALGAQFYGKAGPYNAFAGIDASRALALGSLDPKDVARIDVDDFTEEQLAALREQHKFYLGKYQLVGRLAAPAPTNRQ